MSSRRDVALLAVTLSMLAGGVVVSACAGTPWDPALSPNAHRNELLAHGVRARAEVISFYDPDAAFSPYARNAVCSCLFTVRVTPPDGAPFEAQIKQIVPMMKVPLYQPGSILTIRYAPGKAYDGIVEAEGYVVDAGTSDAAAGDASLDAGNGSAG